MIKITERVFLDIIELLDAWTEECCEKTGPDCQCKKECGIYEHVIRIALLNLMDK